MDVIAANHYKQSVLLLYWGYKANIHSRNERFCPLVINVKTIFTICSFGQMDTTFLPICCHFFSCEKTDEQI